MPRPVHLHRCTVDEVAKRSAHIPACRPIAEIGGHHPHRAPPPAPVDGGGKSHGLHAAYELAKAGLLAIEEVAHLLQAGQYALRLFVGPVGKHHDMVAVSLYARSLLRHDDDRTTEASLFLERGMTVVPVRAALLHFEPIGKCLSWLDAGEAQPWHAIHVGWKKNAVPVNRANCRQPVRDPDGDSVALVPVQSRCRDLAVDYGGDAFGAGEADGHRPDLQVETIPSKLAPISRCSKQRTRAQARESQDGADSLQNTAAPTACAVASDI